VASLVAVEVTQDVVDVESTLFSVTHVRQALLVLVVTVWLSLPLRFLFELLGHLFDLHLLGLCALASIERLL
jgi:hypothetical protein